MTAPRLRPTLIASVLLSLAGLLLMLLPSPSIPSDRVPMPDLARFTPERFDNWVLLSQRSYNNEELNEIVAEDTYSQTFEAIYLGPDNQRIFLSISFGKNQLDSRVQAHRPEYCYRAQGYQISAIQDREFLSSGGTFPIRRLTAAKPGNTEQISYWMTLDDSAVIPGWSRMLAQIKYGLLGTIPDGLLIRVSSPSEEPVSAYLSQTVFINDWLKALPDPLSSRLTGL